MFAIKIGSHFTSRFHSPSNITPAGVLRHVHVYTYPYKYTQVHTSTYTTIYIDISMNT